MPTDRMYPLKTLGGPQAHICGCLQQHCACVTLSHNTRPKRFTSRRLLQPPHHRRVQGTSFLQVSRGIQPNHRCHWGASEGPKVTKLCCVGGPLWAAVHLFNVYECVTMMWKWQNNGHLLTAHGMYHSRITICVWACCTIMKCCTDWEKKRKMCRASYTILWSALTAHMGEIWIPSGYLY